MSQWSFEPILDSYLVVLAIGVVLVLVLLAPSVFVSLSKPRRRILLGLRLAVIVLALLALLRPTWITTSDRKQSAVLILMVDLSRSMLLPNTGGAGQSRWEAQAEALRAATPLLLELRKSLDVKIYGFDSELKELKLTEAGVEAPEKPAGVQTDIGSNLHRAVRKDLGQRIAGIILLSDGAQTATTPPVELHQAGLELARLDYPLYTVAFGPAGDASQFADVAVESLPEHYTVFVKNELTVGAWLRARGFVNQPIDVSLEIEGPGGKRVLGPQQLSVTEDGQRTPIRIRYAPQEPGQYKLTVKAAEQPRERVTKNNQLTAFLTVLDGGLKVGYLIGGVFSGPPGEQIRLRRSLAASPDIKVKHKFIYDSDEDRQRWPVSIRDFLDGSIDVLLIENLDSTALGPQNLEALVKLTDKGMGLMMIGGFHSFGPGGYGNTPLKDVLPIEMGRFERQELGVGKAISKDLHLMKPLKMLPFRPHPITRLTADAQENKELWGKLPPLVGANKFSDVKPSGQVLSVSENNDPLLVSGEYGRGRVLAFAGDSTRRWWKDHSQVHRRFWRQVVLWLAHRDDVQRNDVWVRLPQRRYEMGSEVSFEAGAKTSAGDVIPDAELTATLTAPDKKQTPLVLARRENQFAGRIPRLTAPGQYSIEVVARRGPATLGTARADFQILDRDAELSNPAAEPEQLARLAAQTRGAGGRVVPVEKLPALLEEILRKPPELQIAVQSKWQLASTWWDAWLFFLVFVGLLTTEWTLRKRWRLV